MKLEDLISVGATQPKQSRCSNGDGLPVKITTIVQGNRERLAMDIYEEPANCHFGNTIYWKPIYVRNAKRIYLVYSDKSNGYKAQAKSDNKIGRIEWVNRILLNDITPMLNEKNSAHFNWKWDKECARPYVELVY